MADLKLPRIASITVAGRLVRDSDFTTTHDNALLRFTIAVDQYSAGKKLDAMFLTVTCWDKLAQGWRLKLLKGTAVLVEGRLSSRKYFKQGSDVEHTAYDVTAQRLYELEWRTNDAPATVKDDDADLAF